MADLVFIAVAVAFFGLCVAYVRSLDRMMQGSEEAPLAVGREGADQDPVEAGR